MKLVYLILCCKGFENVGYIDDIYFKDSIFRDCKINVFSIVKLFIDLGFILNMVKLVFILS